MIKRSYLLLLAAVSLIYMLQPSTPTDPQEDFFDTNFLKNHTSVRKALKQANFFEVNFKTDDNININGVMLDQSNKKEIKTTLLICAGFMPGDKEGMTTLYAMFKEQPYNFLFFDARGHGQSDGNYLSYQQIKHYGEKEFHDIVAAVDFINNYNDKHFIESNIVIYGLCSGAFHTVRALAYLRQKNSPLYNKVKGVVFDSGWTAVSEVTESSISSEIKKQLRAWNLNFLYPIINVSVIATYRLFFKKTHQSQKSIEKEIETIDKPILFIHSHDDCFAPICFIKKLVAKAQKSVCWFIDKSTHACHHLKHKNDYKIKMQDFLESIL